MVKIQQPQRFYQFSFKECGSNVDTIIDLKIVTQISFEHKGNCKEDRIIINTNSPEPPIIVALNENECGNEVYSKLVTAWTTYKLATEN